MSCKLTLQMDHVTTSWEWNHDEEDPDFKELLTGFLGCAFGQTFVPGTEIEVFRDYIDGMNFDHGYQISSTLNY